MALIDALTQALAAQHGPQLETGPLGANATLGWNHPYHQGPVAIPSALTNWVHPPPVVNTFPHQLPPATVNAYPRQLSGPQDPLTALLARLLMAHRPFDPAPHRQFDPGWTF